VVVVAVVVVVVEVVDVVVEVRRGVVVALTGTTGIEASCTATCSVVLMVAAFR
jgi:hypothetical protein